MTGVFNRYKLGEDLAGFCKKDLQRLCVGILDIDCFKEKNDTYGHLSGDDCLKDIASIIQDVVSKHSGKVYRYGGDEFLIFLYTDDRDIFKEKAERIYQIIDEADGFSAEISEKLGQSFSIDKQHQISCSIGIAAGDHICTENDMTEMIKRADDLLYSIKTTTKGTYRI